MTAGHPAPDVPLLVVAAPGALPDAHAARRTLDRALADRGVTGELRLTGSLGEVADVVGEAPGNAEVVVVPGTGVDVAHLSLPGDRSLLRLDLADRPRDPSTRVRRHLRGRGLDGVRYAVDAWHLHRASPPAVVHRYGVDRDQHADLRLPSTPPGPSGHPVAVLVHGGYWRSRWESDLMEPMAADLTARGWATWNVEYRRPDDHHWRATTADVEAAFRALTELDGRLDLSRVVLLGHSAGGQLVMRLAADLAADRAAVVRPALTVALAGVLDLAEADRRRLGDGAVARALGGRADDVREVLRAASPVERLPIGSPLAVVCGTQDDPHLLAMTRDFLRAARAAGDDVVGHEGPGDHFAVIDPRSRLWPAIAGLVRSRGSG